jgi:membrane associated rhomboid family serine protease
MFAPPVTQALLIINVVVFFLQQMTASPLEAWFALWPPGSFESRFQVWQVITYSFLHASTMHIVFNMLGLYTFGADLERLFGSRFFALYYFASVLAAGVLHLVITSWMGGPAYPTVGASGGVYGLLLAYGLYFPHRQLLLLFPPIPMKARTFVIVFAVLELFFGVTGTAAGVAHFAHLGGMLGGFLMLQYRKGMRRG